MRDLLKSQPLRSAVFLSCTSSNPGWGQEEDKACSAEAGGEESEGSVPGSGSACGKANLHMRPLGGLVGVDCSVCMVRAAGRSPGQLIWDPACLGTFPGLSCGCLYMSTCPCRGPCLC